MAYNFEPPVTTSITTTGRYYLQLAPFGSMSIQVQTVAGLTFTVEVSNDQSVFSNAQYAQNGVAATLGDAVTPSANDIIDVAPGNFKWVVINVSAGTGTLSSMPGAGMKFI